jgi:hypothetical protein
MAQTTFSYQTHLSRDRSVIPSSLSPKLSVAPDCDWFAARARPGRRQKVRLPDWHLLPPPDRRAPFPSPSGIRDAPVASSSCYRRRDGQILNSRRFHRTAPSPRQRSCENERFSHCPRLPHFSRTCLVDPLQGFSPLSVCRLEFCKASRRPVVCASCLGPRKTSRQAIACAI